MGSGNSGPYPSEASGRLSYLSRSQFQPVGRRRGCGQRTGIGGGGSDRRRWPGRVPPPGEQGSQSSRVSDPPSQIGFGWKRFWCLLGSSYSGEGGRAGDGSSRQPVGSLHGPPGVPGGPATMQVIVDAVPFWTQGRFRRTARWIMALDRSMATIVPRERMGQIRETATPDHSRSPAADRTGRDP
jgi:hypothetical protein